MVCLVRNATKEDEGEAENQIRNITKIMKWYGIEDARNFRGGVFDLLVQFQRWLKVDLCFGEREGGREKEIGEGDRGFFLNYSFVQIYCLSKINT